MTLIPPSFNSSSNFKNTHDEEKEFTNKLDKISHPHFFNRHLIAGKTGIYQTNIFRIMWEILKGAFGFDNMADEGLVKCQTLEFLKERQWTHSKECSAQVQALAERAGLMTLPKNASEELKSLINDIRKILNPEGSNPHQEKISDALVQRFRDSYHNNLSHFKKISSFFNQSVIKKNDDEIKTEQQSQLTTPEDEATQKKTKEEFSQGPETLETAISAQNLPVPLQAGELENTHPFSLPHEIKTEQESKLPTPEKKDEATQPTESPTAPSSLFNRFTSLSTRVVKKITDQDWKTVAVVSLVGITVIALGAIACSQCSTPLQDTLNAPTTPPTTDPVHHCYTDLSPYIKEIENLNTNITILKTEAGAYIKEIENLNINMTTLNTEAEATITKLRIISITAVCIMSAYICHLGYQNNKLLKNNDDLTIHYNKMKNKLKEYNDDNDVIILKDLLKK